jgi:sugar transferase (PEP-CTERM/EpsH1 system associated)
MRILFLAHRLPYPPNKGDKIRSFRELTALSRTHEVDLFCFYDQPEDRDYLPELGKYCPRVYGEKISWFRSRAQASLACIVGRPFTTAFYRSPTMTKCIRKAIAERKYELIFVFSSSMAPYVEGFSEPRVLDMVDVDSDKWTQYADHTLPPQSWLWLAEGRRLAKYEERWAREFSMTLLSTRSEADLLRHNVPGAQIEELENRMDMSYFDPSTVGVPAEIAAWQPYIIFTGSMDYFPNVDAVLFFYREVFALVRGAIPRARFVIAGRNPTRAVRELAVDPAVWVTGAVADIRPYLRGASVAVAPLRVARGVQTKIFEALAMGIPVAVSGRAARALPEPLRHQIHVEDDPKRLAAYLTQKLMQEDSTSNPGARNALGRYYENLNWEDQLDRLIHQALSTQEKTRTEGANSSYQWSRNSMPSHIAFNEKQR